MADNTLYETGPDGRTRRKPASAFFTTGYDAPDAGANPAATPTPAVSRGDTIQSRFMQFATQDTGAGQVRDRQSVVNSPVGAPAPTNSNYFRDNPRPAPAPTNAPVGANGLRAGIAGAITRNGVTTEYSAEDLQRIGGQANVGGFSSTPQAQVEADPNDAIRQRLRDRVLSGGIGSRAALEGLISMDANDSRRATAEASALRNANANSIAAARLGLEQSREARAVRTEFTDATATQLNRLLNSDSDRQKQYGSRIQTIANEIGTVAGLDASMSNTAIRAAQFLDRLSEESGFGPWEGGFTPESLSQFRNLTLNAEDNTITYQDAGGDSNTVNIGGFLGMDLSNREAAEMFSVFRSLGVPFNIQ